MRLNRRQLLLAGSMMAGSAIIPSEPRSAVAQNGTPPGQVLFVRSGNIWRWRDGEASMIIEDGAASDPRWSPDASEVLFVRTGDSYSDLYIRTLFDNSEIQITFNQAVGYQQGSQEYVFNSIWVMDPYWSPSGVIAYASDYFTPYGVMALWVMSFPGATPSLYLTDPGNQNVEGVTLSADGSVAAYTARMQTGDTGAFLSYVAIQDLGSLESRALIEEPEGAFDPAIEPGGMRVAATIRRGGVSDIWLYDRAGEEPVQVTTSANATKPCWLSDGSWLAYLQMVDFKFEARAVPVNGVSIGDPVTLFTYDDLSAPSGLSWIQTN